MSTLIFLAKSAIIVAVAGYVGACALMYAFQARFLFPGAYMPLPPEVEDYGRSVGLTEASVTAKDGTVLRVLTRAPAEGQPVILVFHGNASYPESYGFLYESWIAAGWGVVAPVARGYPRSGGKASGEAMLADALDVRDWIGATYPGHPVIAFGQSLGTGSAVHVAARRDVTGTVLVSPFSSMLSLVGEKVVWLPARLLLASPFRSDLDMPEATAPVAIFHGERDTLIPIAHGRKLAALAKAPVTFTAVPGAGHNDGLFDAEMMEAIRNFVARSTRAD